MNKFATYAEKHPIKVGIPCLICQLPRATQDEMSQAKNDGATYKQILACLLAPKPEGYGYARGSLTLPMVSNHLRGHPNRAPRG